MLLRAVEASCFGERSVVACSCFWRAGCCCVLLFRCCVLFLQSKVLLLVLRPVALDSEVLLGAVDATCLGERGGAACC